jgi:hypothetical protein
LKFNDDPEYFWFIFPIVACDSSSNCKTCSSGLAGTCLNCETGYRYDSTARVCQGK